MKYDPKQNINNLPDFLIKVEHFFCIYLARDCIFIYLIISIGSTYKFLQTSYSPDLYICLFVDCTDVSFKNCSIKKNKMSRDIDAQRY